MNVQGFVEKYTGLGASFYINPVTGRIVFRSPPLGLTPDQREEAQYFKDNFSHEIKAYIGLHGQKEEEIHFSKMRQTQPLIPLTVESSVKNNTWTEVITKISNSIKPHMFNDKKWEILKSNIKTLISFTDELIEHNYSLVEVLGCHPVFPETRLDYKGFALLISPTRKIKEILADKVVFRIANEVIQTSMRKVITVKSDHITLIDLIDETILECREEDSINAGQKHAIGAAELYGCKEVSSSVSSLFLDSDKTKPMNDYNDIHLKFGLDEVITNLEFVDAKCSGCKGCRHTTATAVSQCQSRV